MIKVAEYRNTNIVVGRCPSCFVPTFASPGGREILVDHSHDCIRAAPSVGSDPCRTWTVPKYYVLEGPEFYIDEDKLDAFITSISSPGVNLIEPSYADEVRAWCLSAIEAFNEPKVLYHMPTLCCNASPRRVAYGYKLSNGNPWGMFPQIFPYKDFANSTLSTPTSRVRMSCTHPVVGSTFNCDVVLSFGIDNRFLRWLVCVPRISVSRGSFSAHTGPLWLSPANTPQPYYYTYYDPIMYSGTRYIDEFFLKGGIEGYYPTIEPLSDHPTSPGPITRYPSDYAFEDDVVQVKDITDVRLTPSS